MTRLSESAPESRAGSPQRRRRRLLAKSGLLLLLAVASCFAAVSAVAVAASGIADGAAGSVSARTSSVAPSVASPSPVLAVTPSPATTPLPAPSLTPTGDVSAPPTITASPVAAPTATVAAPTTRPTTKPAAVRPAVTTTRNSLAIPALRIDAPIGVTTCGGLIPNGIWQWTCAGQNNFYLLGHAWGVFKPLHDGYHAGLLTPGMVATYTDRAGEVHRYRLLWVEHLTVADWGKGAAWAATSGPVITLQTCDGATDAYRIIVRFVPA